jgi:hypothetical protein
VTFFTWRDSGGFYLDRGAAHDFGGEYLLFLVAPAPGETPAPPPHTTGVNYNCGQSRPWNQVSARTLRDLDSWSLAHR